jgi:hypothetical protein
MRRGTMVKRTRGTTTPPPWKHPSIPSARVIVSIPDELVGPILVLSVHARPKDLGVARRAYFAERKAGKPVWVHILSSKPERIERQILQPAIPLRQPQKDKIQVDTQLLETIRQLQPTPAGVAWPAPLNVSYASKILGVDRQTIRRALKRTK